MTERERAAAATELLKKEYPGAVCSLVYTVPHELLIATRLSAQCTDARVNLVTPALFGKFPSVDAFAEADTADIEDIIRPCGFFRTKAKDIRDMCVSIRDDFGGKVPDTMEELTSLPGVGRKTANLILGDVYGRPSYVCDTHLIRITNFLGLVNTKDPLKVEMKLRELIEPEESGDFCHRCVLHGRAVCVARRPQCGSCVLKEICAAGSGQALTEKKTKPKG